MTARSPDAQTQSEEIGVPVDGFTHSKLSRNISDGKRQRRSDVKKRGQKTDQGSKTNQPQLSSSHALQKTKVNKAKQDALEGSIGRLNSEEKMCRRIGFPLRLTEMKAIQALPLDLLLD